MRHSQIIFLCFLLLVLVGCHNNAHLRTQKILKPGEKAYSASGVLAVGGETRYGRLDYTGVPGIRGEVSMLTGREGGEAGPYFGIGLGPEFRGYVGGFEYKQYRIFGSGAPKKLGIQGELNYTPKRGWDAYGSTLHFRPSFTTTTTKEQYAYGGIHGVLARGSLVDISNRNIAYDFNSLGLGITAGVEYLFLSSSIQIQIDASLLRNTYDPSDEYSIYDTDNFDFDEESQSTFLLTGSAGVSFFKPDPTNKESFEPLPAPSYNTGQAQAQPVFDPETGEKISSGLRFDPETGEAIIETQFDPETGEAIVEKQTGYKFVDDAAVETQFDPETGRQIAVTEEKQKMSYDEILFQAKNAANSRHNRATYNAAGIASCFIYPVGLPVAILYTESGVASTMNPYDPVYLDLDPNQKNQYKHAYKKEEKQLRRKSIYGAEGFCVGLVLFATMMGF